jgi:hypothetical protein
MQCVRAHITCPGYRDAASMCIRDMTTSIASKVQQKARHKSKSVGQSGRTHSYHPTKPHSPEETAVPVYRLPLPIEDVALGYFMTKYAPTTPFNYLPGIWSTSAVGENVRMSTYAPALTSLALESRQPQLITLARGYYSKALARTNEALRDPQLAVLDSTLLNVLLLSMFEGLVFRGRDSPRSWAAHIHGAAALLSFRGEEQLGTELGQKLFHHASLNIRTCCSQQFTPVPAEVSRLHACAATILDANNPRIRMGMLLDRMATLRAKMRGMQATDMVREALYLDREVADILKRTERLSFKVIRSADCAVEAYTYKDHIYLYNSQDAARYWNVMRMLRLFFNEWIFCAFRQNTRGVVVDLPEPEDPLYEDWDRLPMMAMANGEEMIDDVLAGVPFSLDLLEKPSRISARFLVWPLASIGCSELCPKPAKEFIINRLNALGERHDLDQANEAAMMLEECGPIESW